MFSLSVENQCRTQTSEEWPKRAKCRHAGNQTQNERKLLPSEGVGVADDVATVGTSDDIQNQKSVGGDEINKV